MGLSTYPLAGCGNMVEAVGGYPGLSMSWFGAEGSLWGVRGGLVRAGSLIDWIQRSREGKRIAGRLMCGERLLAAVLLCSAEKQENIIYCNAMKRSLQAKVYSHFEISASYVAVKLYMLTWKRDQALCFSWDGISGNPSMDRQPLLHLRTITWELTHSAAASMAFCCSTLPPRSKWGTYLINSTLEDISDRYRMDMQSIIS